MKRPAPSLPLEDVDVVSEVFKRTIIWSPPRCGEFAHKYLSVVLPLEADHLTYTRQKPCFVQTSFWIYYIDRATIETLSSEVTREVGVNVVPN